MKKFLSIVLISLVLFNSCKKDDVKEKIIEVASIEITPSSLNMIIGTENDLVASVLPEDAKDKSLTWTSSDETIAKIIDGKVSAIKEGIATITVTAKNKVKAECKVTVTKDPSLVASITLDKTTLDLFTKGSITLVATVLPETATNKKFSWSTSDDAILSITDGFAYAKAVGTAIITATTEDGDKTATCTVNITEETFPVESITLNTDKISTGLNNIIVLNATILPAKATIKTISWSSSDESIATVNEGVVTTKAEGSAVITATTTDGNKTASCSFTISNEAPVSAPVLNEVVRSNEDAPYLTMDLSWTASVDKNADKVVYDIYFSTAENPTNVVIKNLEDLTCSALLDYNIKYYWKVVAKNTTSGVNSSTIGSFTTPRLGLIPTTFIMPRGAFMMGGTGGVCEKDEAPVHEVTISTPFEMGIYEITQAQWKAVMGIDNNPSYYKGNNVPVHGISWDDAQTFISKLNALTNQTYRLPTEAEWEFSARGGNSDKNYTYSGSNTIDDVCWYADNSGFRPNAVGSKLPNELGIYDMSGNIEEWCADWVGTYGADPITDPKGPETGTYRVLRGGSGFAFDTSCRVTFRNYDTQTYGSAYYGMRIVKGW